MHWVVGLPAGRVQLTEAEAEAVAAAHKPFVFCDAACAAISMVYALLTDNLREAVLAILLGIDPPDAGIFEIAANLAEIYKDGGVQRLDNVRALGESYRG